MPWRETMAEPIDPARLETLPPTTTAGPTRRTPLGSGYLLEHPIGEGSTGRVWRGIRRADGSAVAIKVLHAEYLPDATMVARYRREASTRCGARWIQDGAVQRAVETGTVVPLDRAPRLVTR